MKSLNQNVSLLKTNLLKPFYCGWTTRQIKMYKRCFSNTKVRKLFMLLLLLAFPLGYIIFIKFPNERVVKSAEVTAQINAVLGTRITAVKLRPEENTTRIQPTLECDSNSFGVILIKSTPESYNRRHIIRETWFNYFPQVKDWGVKAFFFIGVPTETNVTMSLIKEIERNKDIIIEDLQENYYLLALKSLRMLKWFNANQACLGARYFIKTDDDMFLNIPNIISHINSVPQAWVNYIGGQLHISDPVDTDPSSKWFSPKEWWPEPFYPPFVSGALTVISSEVVPQLLASSVTIPLFHLEDVFLIGMLAFDKLSLVPSNMPRIESNSPHWIVRLKMALSFRDLPKTNLAFHCSEEIGFMRDLYHQAIS